jgi:hypothetical protein
MYHSPEAPDQAGQDVERLRSNLMWPGKLAHRLRSHLHITRYARVHGIYICTSMAAKHGQSLPHLQSGEVTLLDYSADDPRDVLTLSDKEALVLQLYNQVQEQQLEKAFLEQGESDKSFAMLFFLFFVFPLLFFCLSLFSNRFHPIRTGIIFGLRSRRTARNRRT